MLSLIVPKFKGGVGLRRDNGLAVGSETQTNRDYHAFHFISLRLHRGQMFSKKTLLQKLFNRYTQKLS